MSASLFAKQSYTGSTIHGFLFCFSLCVGVLFSAFSLFEHLQPVFVTEAGLSLAEHEIGEFSHRSFLFTHSVFCTVHNLSVVYLGSLSWEWVECSLASDDSVAVAYTWHARIVWKDWFFLELKLIIFVCSVGNHTNSRI